MVPRRLETACVLILTNICGKYAWTSSFKAKSVNRAAGLLIVIKTGAVVAFYMLKKPQYKEKAPKCCWANAAQHSKPFCEICYSSSRGNHQLQKRYLSLLVSVLPVDFVIIS